MNKNKILCCIPARYHSTRLPGKPLLKINNKTIIQHVYEKAKKTKVDDIIILTDNIEIYERVISFGANCKIIEEKCLNGTDRIIKYLQSIDHKQYEIIVNIQGDEPFINPKVVNLTIDNLLFNQNKNKNDIVCSTVCCKTKNKEEIELKSRGKVVIDSSGNILYCSRNVIPTSKNIVINEDIEYNIHVGIFVYKKKYLLQHFLNENTPNQLIEDIEWLKIIEQGFKINTIFAENIERGIDTHEDYEYLLEKYK